MIHKKKKLTKLKEDLIKIFKNPKEVFYFLFPIIIFFIAMIPVPYYIIIGGGTIKIDKKIEVKNEYEYKGVLNAAYVKETKGTLITYLLSYVMPNYEKVEIEDVTLKDEEIKDYNFREKLEFTSSIESAKKLVFKKLKKPIEIWESSLQVLYIDKFANTDLKVQDKIIKVDNKKIKDIKEIQNILDTKKVGDQIKILVKRDKKEILTTTKIINYNNDKKLGIYIATNNRYKTIPDVKMNFTNKEAGPSGGLMISLSLYNKLTKEDITKGKTIVGTGTIDEDGKVGEIGGIKYKLKGAIKAKADVFLTPKKNYKEAMNEKIKNNYDIQIIGVSTFDEAIKALNRL